MITNLDVILWDKKVGTLVSSPKGYNKEICFYFDPDFVKSGYDIAPLRAPINGIAAQKGLPIYPEDGRLFGGLPSFIADSMPDQWGNTVFSEWAKAHNIRSKDLSPLDRLAYIGRRGMGALEFVPPISNDMEMPFKVEIAELSKLAQVALKEAEKMHLKMSPDFVVESLFKVGTSAGGRRPKAVINVNIDSGECYSGQVAAPAPGFVPMIIKFDEHCDIPTTRIEYSYYLMALDAGMKMKPSRLMEGEKETHFLTEQFDREGSEKLHVQTLAALNPLASSYEDLFDVAVKLGATCCEIQQLYLQMVMNVVGGNIDDHNKNFSFIMDKDGVWHIAPVYDYTFTVDPSAPSYINRHSMTINGNNQGITKTDLMEIARKYNVKGALSVIEKVKSVAGKYRDYAIRAGVADNWIAKIEEEIAARIGSING